MSSFPIQHQTGPYMQYNWPPQPPLRYATRPPVGPPVGPLLKGSPRWMVAIAIIVGGVVLIASAFFEWAHMNGWFDTYDAGLWGVDVSLPGVGGVTQHSYDSAGSPGSPSGSSRAEAVINSYVDHPGVWAIVVGIFVCVGGLLYVFTQYRSAAAIGVAVISGGGFIVLVSLLVDVRGMFNNPPYWSEGGHYSPGFGLLAACGVALITAGFGAAALVLERRSASSPQASWSAAAAIGPRPTMWYPSA